MGKKTTFFRFYCQALGKESSRKSIGRSFNVGNSTRKALPPFFSVYKKTLILKKHFDRDTNGMIISEEVKRENSILMS
jgi:hypothetical protein